MNHERNQPGIELEASENPTRNHPELIIVQVKM
jgi:hypothetical protein